MYRKSTSRISRITCGQGHYELLSERPETVRAFVGEVSRNHFKSEAVDDLLLASAGTVGLTVGLEVRTGEIRRIMTRWTLLQEHMAAVDERLTVLVDEIPSAKALTTVPGVSIVCAATIVAELGDPMSYVSPRQVLKLAGMNLAGKQSEVSVNGRVKQTKRGRPALRRQLFLLAGRWCQKRGLYREHVKREESARQAALRISLDVGHPFHSMSDRHFTPCRTPISHEVGQSFHLMSDTS